MNKKAEIKEVFDDSVLDSSGNKHYLDALVFATGFNANRFLWPMEVKGLKSSKLNEVWKEDNPKSNIIAFGFNLFSTNLFILLNLSSKKLNLFGNFFAKKFAYFWVNLSRSIARTFVLENFKMA